MCLSVFLLGFILYGTLCFLDLGYCFLSHVREVFSYYLFKYFLRPFLSFPSETPIIWMLVHFMLSQRSLRLSLFLSFFFLYSIPQQWVRLINDGEKAVRILNLWVNTIRFTLGEDGSGTFISSESTPMTAVSWIEGMQQRMRIVKMVMIMKTMIAGTILSPSRACHCAKYFIYMFTLDPHDNHVRWISLFPLYRWGLEAQSD